MDAHKCIRTISKGIIVGIVVIIVIRIYVWSSPYSKGFFESWRIIPIYGCYSIILYGIVRVKLALTPHTIRVDQMKIYTM